MWIRSRETMKKYYKNIGHGLCGHSLLLYKQFSSMCQCSPRSLYSFTNWTGLTYNYKFVGLNSF